MKLKLFCLSLIILMIVSAAWSLNFTRQSANLEDYTQMHGLVVSNGYVYVIGGNRSLDADSFKTSFATLSPTGVFGTFTSPSSMFVPTSSNDSGAFPNSQYIEFSSFAINSNVYRIGGSWNSGNPASSNNGDSIWAGQNLNGSLGSWNVRTPFPTGNGTGGLWTGATYVKLGSGTYVYACGGQLDSGIDNKVYRSTVGVNGSLSVWTTVTPMPASMWFEASYASNTHLYVLGMLTTAVNTGTSSAIYHTTINPDGSINAWDTNTTLFQPSLAVYGPVSGFSKHFAYVIGGRSSGGTRQGNAYIAPVNPNGTLSNFTAAGLLTVNNSTSAAVHYTPSVVITINNQEKILIVGGRYSLPNTLTNLVSDATYMGTNAGGYSNAIFLSDSFYTLPSLANGPVLNLKPSDVVTLTVNDGTGPYGSWTTSNGAIGALSGIGGSTAIFTASVSAGTTIVTVSDAYSDAATITIVVALASAPLAPETEAVSKVTLRDMYMLKE